MRFNKPAPLLRAALITAALSAGAPLDLSTPPSSPRFADLANTPPSSPGLSERLGSPSASGVTGRDEISSSPEFADHVVTRASPPDDVEPVERHWGHEHERPIECTNLIVIFARGTTEV